MSLDFSTIKSIVIPEGEVLSISVGGDIMWQKDTGETYTYLEYIQGSGSQWIDTDVIVDASMIISIQVAVDSLSANQYRYLFSDGSSGSISLSFRYAQPRAALYAKYFSSSGSQITTATLATIQAQHEYAIDSGYLYYDGGSLSRLSTQGRTSSSSLKLLTQDQSACLAGKLYDFFLEQGGEQLMHLVPAQRDSDGAVGMYDEITDTFLENQGSGDFTPGPAL